MNIIRKNVFPFLLLCFLVLSPRICVAQSKTLHLHFPNQGNEKDITLRYSIHGIQNYMYEPYIKNYKTADKNLTIIIPDTITSFIMKIDSKPTYYWGKNVNIYMDKEGSLEIELDTVAPPHFSGKNAALQNFMFQLKNGTGNERIEKTWNNFLKDTSSNSFFSYIDHCIQSESATLDRIYKNNKIDVGFYEYAKGVLIDDYLYRASMNARRTDNAYLQKMDSSTFFSDMDKLFTKYQADQTDGLCLSSKASLRMMNLIRGTKLDLGLIYDSNPYLLYLSKAEQEKRAAGEIIINSAGLLDSLQLANSVAAYKKVFPKSVYLRVLGQLKVSDNKEFILAHFSKKDGFTEYGRFKINSLQDITKMFLYGKTVFVDFWATWCPSCINEFNYRDQIEPFFKKNNIETMYISLDYGRAYKEWKAMIIDKKLEGYHYLGTLNIQSQLPYFKESNSIPRFILLDKDGQLLIDKCANPSSGDLIPQIEKALKLEAKE